MSYKVKYESEFKDNKGQDIKIQIKRNYNPIFNPQKETLLLSENPLYIDYTVGDNLFKPTKLSGCSINYLLKKPIEEMYSTKITENVIEIYNGNDLLWTGFNTPNAYSQMYQSTYDNITINGIDCISALRYFKYEYISETDKGKKSIAQVLAQCFKNTNILTNITSLIYVNRLSTYPDVEQGDVSGNPDVLEDYFILEKNFFNERNEPMTCLEVVEEICKILGVTIYQYKDCIYMIDPTMAELGNRPLVGVYQFPDLRLNSSTGTDRYNGFQGKDYKQYVNDITMSIGDVYSNIKAVANFNEYEQNIVEWGNKYTDNLEAIGNQHTFKILIGGKNSVATADMNTPYSDIVKDELQVEVQYYNNEDLNQYFIPVESQLEDVNIIGNEGDDGLADRVMFEICKYKKNWMGIVFSGVTTQERDLNNNEYYGLAFKIFSKRILPFSDSNFGFDTDKELTAFQTKWSMCNLYVINRWEHLTLVPIYTKKTDYKIYNSNDKLVISMDVNFTRQLLNGLPLNSGWANNGSTAVDEGKIHNFNFIWTGQTYPRVIDKEVVFANNSGKTNIVIPFMLACQLKIGEWYYCDEGGHDTASYKQPYWTTEKKYCVLKGEYVKAGDSINQTFTVYNDNDDTVNINSTEKGYVVNLNAKDADGNPITLAGELEFTICNAMAVPQNTFDETGKPVSQIALSVNDNGTVKESVKGNGWFANFAHISNLKISYASQNVSKTVFDLTQELKDVIYTKEIDKDNISEMEDITLKINTGDVDKYNKNSYSYLYDGSNNRITTLQKDFMVEDAKGQPNTKTVTARPEEHIVQTYVNYYSKPRHIITNTLVNNDIEPLDIIKNVQHFGNMIVGDISYNVKYNSCDTTLYEPWTFDEIEFENYDIPHQFRDKYYQNYYNKSLLLNI